jgi:peptidoglycan lytic transglycosylase
MNSRWKNPNRALLFLMVLAVQAVPAFSEPRSSGPSSENESVLVLPYIAVGGMQETWHFLTLLILKNPDSHSKAGTLEFYRSDGRPLRVQLNNGAALSVQSEWKVSARESKLLTLSHTGGAFQKGWLRIRQPGNSPVEVSAVVQFYDGDHLIGQSGAFARPRNGVSAESPWVEFRGGPNPLWWLQHRGPEPTLVAFKNAAAMPSVSQTIPLGSCYPAPAASAPISLNRFVETGYASWYGSHYHGRVAASGNIFNRQKLTAAHRTLPFGTRAKITNLRNGCSVIVRISDRGPFVPGRIVDLSEAAARELDLLESGVSRVRLERLPS